MFTSFKRGFLNPQPKAKSSSTQQVSVDVENLVLKKNDNKAKEDNTSMENCDTGKEQENRCCPSRNEEYIHHERFCLKLLSSIKKIIANMPDEMVDMKTFENILEYCVELDQLDKNFLHSLSLGDTNIFNIFKDRFSEQFIIVLKDSKGYIRKKGNVRNIDTLPDKNMNTMTSINCNTPNGVQQFANVKPEKIVRGSEEIESVKSQNLKCKCSSISDHSSEYQSRRNELENVSNRPIAYFYSSSSENEDFDDYEKQCVNNTSAFIQTSHRSAIGDKKCGLCSLAATKLHKTISEMEEMRKQLEIKENEYMEKLKSPIGDANDKRKEYLKKENELMDIINSLKANEATLKNQLIMNDSQLTSAIRNIEMLKQDTGLMVTQRDAELIEIEVQNANRKDVQVKPLVSASPLQAVQAEDQKTAGKTDESNVKEICISRCIFWPKCTKGDTCQYYHPFKKCTNFPYCSFGNRCLFIHPACRFDNFCTKKQCPFTHYGTGGTQTASSVAPLTSNKTPIAMVAPKMKENTASTQESRVIKKTVEKKNVIEKPITEVSSIPLQNMIPCRYAGACRNPVCHFKHPKECRFGANCRNFWCYFYHKPSATSAPPTQTSEVAAKYKWKSTNEPTASTSAS